MVQWSPRSRYLVDPDDPTPEVPTFSFPHRSSPKTGDSSRTGSRPVSSPYLGVTVRCGTDGSLGLDARGPRRRQGPPLSPSRLVWSVTGSAPFCSSAQGLTVSGLVLDAEPLPQTRRSDPTVELPF